MKAKNLNTYQTLFIVEEIAMLSVNICYLEILTKAYIAKEFTDLDLSQYITEESVDLIEIYEQVEPMWEQIVSVIGKEKVDNIFRLTKMRYAEINSFDTKIITALSDLSDVVMRIMAKGATDGGDTE